MGMFGTCPLWLLKEYSEELHPDCLLERESRLKRTNLQDPHLGTPDSGPSRNYYYKNLQHPSAPEQQLVEEQKSSGSVGGCGLLVFRMLHLHPFPSQPRDPLLQVCTCLDSVFRRQIEI